jgi:hypothetical protein
MAHYEQSSVKRFDDIHEELTLRMLGQNVTLMRCQWLDLLDELRPDSTLAERIRALLERIPGAQEKRDA